MILNSGPSKCFLQLHVDQKYILIPRLESDFLLYSNACVMELTQFCSDLPGAC